MQYRLQRDVLPGVIDLNAERLSRGIRAIESARGWLRQEVAAMPAAVYVGMLPETFAAHYVFALGQLDRALVAALEDLAVSNDGGLERVRALRRHVDEVLAYCERRARAAVQLDGGARARRWAIRRARLELGPILRRALR